MAEAERAGPGPPPRKFGGSAQSGDAGVRSSKSAQRTQDAFIVVDPVVQFSELLDRIVAAKIAPVCVLINSLERCDEVSEERVLASFRRREPRFEHVVGASNVVTALDRLLALADAEGLRYVGAAAVDSETGQDNVDILASCLGLPHNDLPTLRARRDKVQMKKAVRAAGLRCARYTTCESLSALPAALAPHRFPVVVKAPQGTGSIQVWICNTEEEARAATERVLAKPDFFGRRSLFALIEEFIPGTEFAVNLFAAGGEVHVESIWRYTKERSPAGCPIYRRAELVDCTAAALRPLAEYGRAVARAVGLRLGPAHLEVKWEEGGAAGPCMVEIASRVSGGWKSSMTALVVPEWDAFQAALDVFRGLPPALPASFRPHGAVFHVFLAAPRPGLVRRVRGLPAIRALPSYLWELLFVHEGARVRATGDLFSHPASVFLVQAPGMPRAQLERDEAAARALFALDLVDEALPEGAAPPSPSPSDPDAEAAAEGGAEGPEGEAAAGHKRQREPGHSGGSSPSEEHPSPTPSSPPASPAPAPACAQPAPAPA